MANILGSLTINETKFVELDDNPLVSPTLGLEIGDFMIINNIPGIWHKIGSGLYDITRVDLLSSQSTQDTSNGTLSLVNSSNNIQIFTGTTAGQILNLPDATTIALSSRYEIWNTSTQGVAVRDFGSNGVISVGAGEVAFIILNDTSSSNGIWKSISIVPPTGVSYGSPVTIGTSNDPGVATSVPRSDHVHAHGDQTVGSLHAVVTALVNGFMSSTDKGDHDRLVVIPTDTKEPTGFVNRTDSTVTFDVGTRTLSIAPTVTSFSYYIHGVKYTISTTLSIQIPNTSGNYFFYLNAASSLQYLTAFSFDLITSYAYVSMVVWNSSTGLVSFSEERHGITMDSATHAYLHNAEGARLTSGAAISFTIGDGSSDSHAQIALTGGVIRDEDITVTIIDDPTPTNIFEQILSPIAQLPILYRLGASGDWAKLASDGYVSRLGTLRAQYNRFNLGTWSLEDASANGKFLVSYVLATTDFNNPFLIVLSQTEHNSLNDALEDAWLSLNFGNLPIQEFKVCYRVIYETSTVFTNASKSKIVDVLDFRVQPDQQNQGFSVTDHSQLTGLSDDDHPQYLLRTDLKIKSGKITAVTFTGNPKKATVTFASPYGSLNYNITISGVDVRNWSYESKLAGSFVINTNANQALTGEVSWQTQLDGEVG